MELELTRLTDVKAEFEKLAETDFQESDSDGCDGDGDSSGAEGGGGGRNGKWKQRVKKLQKYVQWQTAEAETQVHDVFITLRSLAAIYFSRRVWDTDTRV